MWGFRPGFLAALASGGGGGSLPLDSLTVAPFFAVSYRKLRTGYGGNCCRIRRYSDNSELNFGFVSGVVDTAGIAAWLAGDRGLVTKRFNQAAGASIDAVQVTGSLQPEIYNSSAFDATLGSHGGVSDGNNDGVVRSLMASGLSLGGTQLQSTVVGALVSSPPSFGVGVDIHGTTDGNTGSLSSALSAVTLAYVSPQLYPGRGTDGAASLDTAFVPGTTPFVLSVAFDGTSCNMWGNGTLCFTRPSTGTFDTLVNVQIGVDYDSHYWAGSLPEIILQAGTNSADRIALQTSANTFWRT